MAMEKQRLNLVSALSFLFYLSTCCGILPYSIRSFNKHKSFKLSVTGNVFSAAVAVFAVVQYHISSQAFSVSDKNETGTLTTIIGIVIIYMEPLMLSIDVIGFLINQKSMIVLIDRMQRVDDKLLKENIEINYGIVRQLTIILVILVAIVEFSLVGYNYYLFKDVMEQSYWWLITCIPLFFSSISKIWYIILVFNVKQKFDAINDHFEITTTFFEELRKKNTRSKQKLSDLEDDRTGASTGLSSPPSTGGHQTFNNGYLHKEINAKPVFKRLNKVQHGVDSNSGGGVGVNKPAARNIIHVLPIGDYPKKNTPEPFFNGAETPLPEMFSSENSRYIIDTKLNKKLTRLCQLHDEICDIGKTINQMFSFQMLILMAYGFMSLTAKFYFVYCGLTDQIIPILFRAAENLPVSMAFIVYTGAKCVYVIFTSWQTKLVAQKTGVKIHKVANVVDEDQCYQIVNHLSLKLLNHHLNFTACGFFELDMTTLYAITGAITSYLIILIQFNLAAQRNRGGGKTVNGNNSTMIVSNITAN